MKHPRFRKHRPSPQRERNSAASAAQRMKAVQTSAVPVVQNCKKQEGKAMAKFCTECGSEIRDGIAFCTNCGAKAEQTAPAQQQMPKTPLQPRPAPQPAAPPAPQPKVEITVDKTVGTGTFFGLMFLFSLPILGWLICLIVAFAAKNQNIKHFARAMLIWLVIALVVGALIGLAINALINSVAPYLEQAMGELGIIGNPGDLGELTELIEQFGSLGDMMGELESLVPTE